MKYIYLLLLFSSFTFGQSIELLKKLNHIDASFMEEFNNILYPNYIFLSSSSEDEGLYINYSLVLKGTTEQELKNCKSSRRCPMLALVRYKLNNGNYAFHSSRGGAEDLFLFWDKEINSDSNIGKSTNIKTYRNDVENVWYNLEPTPNTMMLRNMIVR